MRVGDRVRYKHSPASGGGVSDGIVIEVTSRLVWVEYYSGVFKMSRLNTVINGSDWDRLEAVSTCLMEENKHGND